MEHKGSQVRAEEDADNDVSVVVHGEQHDKVSHSELHHVQKRADRLLADVGAEGRDANGAGGRAVGGLAAIRTSSIVANRRRRTFELGHVLADDVAVEFLDGAAEGFEGHDKEEDTNARSGEHALGGDVPRAGDETGIDGVPVPKHRDHTAGTRAAHAHGGSSAGGGCHIHSRSTGHRHSGRSTHIHGFHCKGFVWFS